MEIKVINGKPHLTKHNFILAQFESHTQASEAAKEIEPMLNHTQVATIPVIISVIRRNGGK